MEKEWCTIGIQFQNNFKMKSETNSKTHCFLKSIKKQLTMINSLRKTI